MLPKISVFLLVYQQVDFIRDTLESVLAQDYPNLEIVVGDDGSTDGTVEILHDYDKKYPGLFKLVLSSVNAGITANSNKILAKCSGDYIALMGGDDLWLPGKLNKQVEWLLHNPDAALCHTKTEVFESTSGETIAFIPVSETSRNAPVGLGEFLKNTPGYVSSSFMIPRWAIPKSGFDERVRLVSDWLFTLEILARGRMGYIDEVLTKYRRHDGNVSAKHSMMFTDMMLACDIAEGKYPQYIRYIKKCRANWMRIYMETKSIIYEVSSCIAISRMTMVSQAIAKRFRTIV